MAVKSILINYSFLVVPTYYLSIYSIPDFILKEINKTVRNFFWHKGGNGKGIHTACWSYITDPKTKGALLSEIFLLLNILLRLSMFSNIWNSDDSIWVDIL